MAFRDIQADLTSSLHPVYHACQALALLNRTEEEQVVWEQEVLEEATSVLDIPIRAQDMQGVVPTPLYTSLLH
jgi:hypothetical protein